MSSCINTTSASFSSIAVLPAFIAAVTSFALFIFKDWLFTTRQRKVFASRLLKYSCSTLALALEIPPSNVDLKISTLENYTDALIGNVELDESFTIYMAHYLRWRAGFFQSASESQRISASEELNQIAQKLK
jgi:hypothetical protein